VVRQIISRSSARRAYPRGIQRKDSLRTKDITGIAVDPPGDAARRVIFLDPASRAPRLHLRAARWAVDPRFLFLGEFRPRIKVALLGAPEN